MRLSLRQLAVQMGLLLVPLLLVSCAVSPTTTSAPTTAPVAQSTPQPGPVTYRVREVTVELPEQSYCPCSIDEEPFNSYQEEFQKYLGLTPVPAAEGIQLIRPVIHFEVLDSHGTVQKSFSPSMRITVQYDSALIEKALTLGSDEDHLVLLILDHGKDSWYEAPDFKLNKTDRLATTIISSWTSHICWGAKPK